MFYILNFKTIKVYNFGVTFFKLFSFCYCYILNSISISLEFGIGCKEILNDFILLLWVLHDCVSFQVEALREDLFPWLFQHPESTGISCLVTYFCVQIQQWPITLLTLTLLPPSLLPLTRTLVITLGPAA